MKTDDCGRQKRQKENERATLVRTYGEDFVKPACAVM